MTTAKITRRVVETLKPTTKPFVVYDTDTKGFGVRVMPSGVAAYIVEYRPGEGGRGVAKKRMALGRTNELTPDEARKLAVNALSAVRHGHDPLLERETRRREIKLKELIDQWEGENPPGRKTGKPMAERTRTYTLARLRHHVVPLIGNKRVSAVTVDDVNDLIRRVSKGETKRSEKSKKKRGRIIVRGGEGAARKVASDLSIIYGYAIEKRIVAENPVTAARKPKPGKRQDYLRADQMAALGAALAKMETEGANASGIAILRLILMTGARPAEIEALTWSEVDLEGRCLRLADSKTGYSTRPLSSAAMAILAKTERVEGTPYVFPATRGEGHFVGSKRLWNRARDIAKLPDRVRYHARHAVATLSLSAGTDVASVAAIMGHKGPRTTLSTYAHVVDDRAARAAEQVAGQITTAMKGKARDNVVALGRTETG